jgi:glyoxylase-like metal-dependent hydrolase (beta-lactamase superfamily II)
VLKKLAVIAICIAFLCGNALAQDAKTVIANAQKALGDVKSITYSGSGKDVSFQQCGANKADMTCHGTHDPMRPIDNYVRVIDLTASVSRATGATNNIIGGGGSTTIGPGNFSQQITAQQTDTSTTWTATAGQGSSVEFYLTPWGFLKGAAANNATVTKSKGFNVLSWSPTPKAPSGKSYVIDGYVNEKTNLIDHVETRFGDNIMGDMLILQTYSGWKDFGGGAMAPAKIVQTRGGWPYFEVIVTAAKANPPDLATLAVPPPRGGGPGGGGGGAPGGPPAGGGAGGGGGRGQGGGGQGGGAVPPVPGGAPPAAGGGPGGGAGGGPGGGAGGGRGGGAGGGPGGGAPGGGAQAAMTVTSEKLGDGLYRLTTGPGSYDSVIVEFKDYVMMLEAGQSEARGLAYIAETKKLIPNKPIRYVMNTHPHSDHTGGLPALVAEGATIITQKNNEEFFERALNTPRTLLNDTLAKNPKRAKVEPVGEKKVYSDGTRTVEMYHIPGAPHSNGLMVAFIPKQKGLQSGVLFQGDFSLPTNPGDPPNDHIKALVPVLEKLNLDFDRYINVHTSPMPQTKADLWKAVKGAD